ncbi:hypothetical protein [Streptosporangium sp. NPDC049376]|uniref:hypothetical protein n=1 Tax=Streptosporangium sp. NPDC049376 TaxID=3366192 RepID=UPI00379CD3AD
MTTDAHQQKRYLRAVERRPLARDHAISRLLFYSGVRIAELVALDDDIPLSARKGKHESCPHLAYQGCCHTRTRYLRYFVTME